jgi:cation transport protein ChaC
LTRIVTARTVAELSCRSLTLQIPLLSRRSLTLTRSHVRKVHCEVAGPGPAPSLRKLAEADFPDLAARLLAENHGAPFWVLAYGSLIWNPAFEHVEARACHVSGWRRSFCLNMTDWRATPDQPGLMLGLDRGGSCLGMAYRMPDDDPMDRMIRLLRREIDQYDHMTWQRWVTVRAGADRFRALAFWCAPARPEPGLLRLPLAEQAARIARAVGHVGSNVEYLLNTVEHLHKLGLHDSYLWDLQALVAAEIEALPG